MSSMEESKRRVEAQLKNVKEAVDHDEILANLQHEIDQHNNKQQDRDHGEAEHPSSLRFRFKSGTSVPRKRKHTSHDHRHRHHRRHRRDDPKESQGEDETAHPFPREPVEPSDPQQSPDPNAAFRESLFDALADDEGAAYWESVYSQPIHIYPRPSVRSARGELERMNDDDYAAYVQTKMWEKKNPHVVRERERRERRRREEEEEKVRRREEFVRRKQRAAWEEAEREGARRFARGDDGGGEYEYVFDFERYDNPALKRSTSDRREEYRKAWSGYLAAWDDIRNGVLASEGSSLQEDITVDNVAKRIPWPALPSKPVNKENIEEFMRWITDCQGDRPKLQLLKSERVRWHPDKMQQRFEGKLDEATMKLVTGVFQVVDSLYEHERGHGRK